MRLDPKQAEPVDAYLTECIYSSILESQVPRKNINLLFTLNNSDRELTVSGGGVTLWKQLIDTVCQLNAAEHFWQVNAFPLPSNVNLFVLERFFNFTSLAAGSQLSCTWFEIREGPLGSPSSVESIDLLFVKTSIRSVAEQRGNNLKYFRDFYLYIKAIIWPWLSCMYHIRSTAVIYVPYLLSYIYHIRSTATVVLIPVLPLSGTESRPSVRITGVLRS